MTTSVTTAPSGIYLASISTVLAELLLMVTSGAMKAAAGTAGTDASARRLTVSMAGLSGNDDKEGVPRKGAGLVVPAKPC